MSTLTKEKAWVIFRADKLGQPEAETAKKSLLGTDWGTYHLYAEEFELKLAQIGIEAQNEAAKIMESNRATVALLETKPVYLYTADDYITFVSLFKDSKYEQLHLSGNFRFTNNELLLELVKP